MFLDLWLVVGPHPTTASIPSGVIRDGQVWGVHDYADANLAHFDDKQSWRNGSITAIQMRCGDYFLAIRVQYNGLWTNEHGFWNENCAPNKTWTSVHTFDVDEHIISAEVSNYEWPTSITFTTNKRTLETCGKPIAANIKTEEGRQLAYFSGVYGCYFDRIQFHWLD